jgi:hypothetical protein
MKKVAILEGVSKKEFFWCNLVTILWSGFWIFDGIYCIVWKNPTVIMQNPVAITHPNLHPLFLMDLGSAIFGAIIIIVPIFFGHLTASIAKKKNMNITIAYIIGFVLPILGSVIYYLRNGVVSTGNGQ